MFLYLGADQAIPLRRIVAIIDAASIRREPATRLFLERAKGRKAFRDVSGGEIASYVVTDTAVYACAVSGTALKRRIERAASGDLFDNEM